MEASILRKIQNYGGFRITEASKLWRLKNYGGIKIMEASELRIDQN